MSGMKNRTFSVQHLLWSVDRPATPYLPTLCHKQNDSLEKVLNIKCVV